MNEEYEDEEDYDEEESESLVLSFGEDGKVEMNKESDYIKMLKSDFDIIQKFIEGKGKCLFNKFVKEYEKAEEKNKK